MKLLYALGSLASLASVVTGVSFYILSISKNNIETKWIENLEKETKDSILKIKNLIKDFSNKFLLKKLWSKFSDLKEVENVNTEDDKTAKKLIEIKNEIDNLKKKITFSEEIDNIEEIYKEMGEKFLIKIKISQKIKDLQKIKDKLKTKPSIDLDLKIGRLSSLINLLDNAYE